MTGAMDRRQQKTRAALHGAFRELLFEQGYESITIGAVARAANVGRSTFYEHYRTKDDLLRDSIGVPFATLARLVDDPACGEAVGNLLQHFRQHRQVARVLFGWPGRAVLSAALADHIAARLARAGHRPSAIPAEVIARQIADMQLALVDAWIAGRPAFVLAAAVDGLIVATRALVQSLHP